MRERRAAHVRPLPPSADRLRSPHIGTGESINDLVRRYRPTGAADRSTSLGMGTIAVVVLAGVLTLVVGGNILVSVVGQLAAAFDSAITQVTSAAPATAAPSGEVLDTPVLSAPDNDGYTNQAIVSISGSVPGAAVGKKGYGIRIYKLDDQGGRDQIAELSVGDTNAFSTGAVTLLEGPNRFVATLVTPSGEGQASPIVVYTLDTRPPPIKVTSPADESQQHNSSVAITGTTDPGTTVSVRNRDAPGGSPATKIVGDDGRFSITVALVAGTNVVDLTATDKAGNTSSTQLTLKRDYGKLAAHFSASPAKFAAASPTTLKLSVQATSEDGSPLDNAAVVYTVTVQGLGPIVSPELTTDANGAATWQVVISGASPGIGATSVLVTSSDGDQVTATIRLTTT
jgi:hypothetical protein